MRRNDLNDLVQLKSGKIMRRWALKVHLEFHKDEENEVVRVFQEVPMNSDYCVVCGQNHVPAGVQVCPSCEARIYGEKK